MTEPKRFKRGKRTYTKVGAHREVRIDSDAPPSAPAGELRIEVPPEAEMPVYANVAAVHRSPDEVIVDLAFAAPARPHPRIRSRIAMSPRLAARLGRMLAKAAEES